MAIDKDKLDAAMREVATKMVGDLADQIVPFMGDVDWNASTSLSSGATKAFHAGGAVWKDGKKIGTITDLRLDVPLIMDAECTLPREVVESMRRKAEKTIPGLKAGPFTFTVSQGDIESASNINDHIMQLARQAMCPLPNVLVSNSAPRDQVYLLRKDSPDTWAFLEEDGFCHPWALVELARKARPLGWRPVRIWKRGAAALYGWKRARPADTGVHPL